jgi:hypothetical protein
MAQGLILEFEGDVGREQYDAVNALLEINVETGEGRWPAGLLYHAGGAKADGWVVFEVWESQEAQALFMSERLGPALGQAGLSAPTRVEWLDLAAHVAPGG